MDKKWVEVGLTEKEKPCKSRNYRVLKRTENEVVTSSGLKPETF